MSARRTYRPDAVQLAAFGIDQSEQGRLLELEQPETEKNAKRCASCAALSAVSPCERCREVSAEPLTLESGPGPVTADPGPSEHPEGKAPSAPTARPYPNRNTDQP